MNLIQDIKAVSSELGDAISKARTSRKELKNGELDQSLDDELDAEEEVLDVENKLLQLMQFEENEVEEVLELTEEYHELRVFSAKKAGDLIDLLDYLVENLEIAVNSSGKKQIEAANKALNAQNNINDSLQQIKDRYESFKEDISEDKLEAIGYIGHLGRAHRLVKEVNEIDGYIDENFEQLMKLKNSDSPELEEARRKVENLHENRDKIAQYETKLHQLDKQKNRIAESLSEEQLDDIEQFKDRAVDQGEIQKCIEDINKLTPQIYTEDTGEKFIYGLEVLGKIAEGLEDVDRIKDRRSNVLPNFGSEKGRRKFLGLIGKIVTVAELGAATTLVPEAMSETYPDMDPERFGNPAFVNDIVSGKGRVEVIVIRLNDRNPEYDGGAVASGIRRALKTLGANVEVNWREVRTSIQWYKRRHSNSNPSDLSQNEIQEVRKRLEDIRKTIRSDKLRAKEHFGGKNKTELAKRLEKDLSAILGKNIFRKGVQRVIVAPFGIDNSGQEVVVSPLEAEVEKKDKPVGNVNPDNVLLQFPTSAFNNNQGDKLLKNSIIHLLGHRMFLSHTNPADADVMGSTNLDELIREFDNDRYFSKKSRKRWNKWRQKFE